MQTKADILSRLGLDTVNPGVSTGPGSAGASGDERVSVSPIDNQPIAAVRQATAADFDRVLDTAEDAFRRWRMIPAPARGQIVRELGDELRANKEALGALVTLETGKILVEGMGEVQEMIDICDFAVGQSRMLYGMTTHSERPGHRMYEQWHPLGPVGIITAFNFPVAVWAWNAAIAAVCGDTCIWKPSPHAPLTAIASTRIAERVLERHGLSGIFNLCIGDVDTVANRLIDERRVPLVSFTGSSAVGKSVAERLGRRFGKGIFECGGNNAIILCADADPELAIRAATFAAVGTAGQRCTTLRRLFVESHVFGPTVDRLVKAWEGASKKIGNPLDPGTLVGPLIGPHAVEAYTHAIATIKEQGGEILFGGEVLSGEQYPGGNYVLPTLVKADQKTMPIMQDEVFAPILYVVEWSDLDDVIGMHNDVPQGLSGAIFTTDMQRAETFLSHLGADTGIANVNIGTSGAEIGGAFGGEKDTGGGRESGSDAWKQYMRRQTCTINWSRELPLAQGIEFDV